MNNLSAWSVREVEGFDEVDVGVDDVDVGVNLCSISWRHADSGLWDDAVGVTGIQESLNLGVLDALFKLAADSSNWSQRVANLSI